MQTHVANIGLKYLLSHSLFRGFYNILSNTIRSHDIEPLKEEESPQSPQRKKLKKKS